LKSNPGKPKHLQGNDENKDFKHIAQQQMKYQSGSGATLQLIKHPSSPGD
jgi:hypothetical protein